MLNNFQTPNTSLSEELYEQAKSIFETHTQRNNRMRCFSKLPQMLRDLKVPIPEPMASQIDRCLKLYPIPRFSFNAFTHYLARATLEEQLEEQLKNLFFQIDRKKTGKVDAQDLAQLLRQLEGGERIGEDGANQLLSEMDFIGVGYLNYQDFVYLLLPK